ncbi:IS1182 family transposase ISDre5 [bioreactor metagenome]|uniref:IS1182 family transposase ISDre5 n=1 Tax=bioreactor metagenome TaxID=1076179 RepID=A0A645CGE2_9ZZZZ
MYIRQESFLSFDEIIKFQPTTKLEMILSQINFDSLLNCLTKPHASRGPKGYNIEPMLNALIAMQVEQIKYRKQLVDRLVHDPVFRYNCGFSVLDRTPSEASFSRFFTKISETKELEECFINIVKQVKELGIITGNNLAIDSTKIDSYERAKPKSQLSNDDVSPNWGMKLDTNGNNIKWFGYKLHIIADTDSELPVSIILTPANKYDSEVAKDILEKFIKDYKSIMNPKNVIADAGYDSKNNFQYITHEMLSQPIIALNQRGAYAPPEGLDENMNPVCSMGYPLVYWGKDGDYLKYRCPHVCGKVSCPQGAKWCSNSDYGYCLKINYKLENRYYTYPPRHTEQYKKLFNKRTSVERVNSRLKEHLNVNNQRSAGIKKAFATCLLSCIALIAGTVAVNKPAA